ncbi:MAG: putative metal-dependent hydrolase [Bacteroidetes bacterium HLUCCA01]|nr:MAG: putative metal-dependent hydrolase [Bacteroidetes bacterium HLUCCA01]
MMELPGCPPVTFIKRRNQRSLRIRVKTDAVIVSAPLRCSERQMADFLRERQDWVRETSARLQEKLQKRRQILDDHRGFVLLHGRWIPLIARPPRPGSADWLLVWRTDRVDVYPPESHRPSIIIPAIEQLADRSTPVGSAPISHSHTVPAGRGAGFGLSTGTTDQPIMPRSGAHNDRDLIDVPADVLKAWVKAEARERLPKEFEALAQTLPFTWSRIFVRSQKTKWGTCSSRGIISLNWRLIHCPEEIRRYIMIHELCHTVHMNHSGLFWSLVAEHYPDYRTAHRWLRGHEQLLFQDGNSA